MKNILVIDPSKEFKQKVYTFPDDYIVLGKKVEVGSIADMLDVVRVLQKETRPVENHPDPNAITACWDELEKKIKGMNQ